MPEDSRKTHVLTTIANYFGIEYDSLSSLSDHRSLNSFLDDKNCPLLSATRGNKRSIDLSNEIKVVEGTQCLVLYKLRPEVITSDNVHTSIFLSSMIDSPLDSLYYMIKSVFTPALRDNNNNNKSNQAATQQIQTSLNELEQVLRSSGKKTHGSSSSSMAIISQPKDEITYWHDIAKSASTKTNDLERAKYFLKLFDPVKGNFENFENLTLLELVDVVEKTQDVYDEIWRQVEYDEYPEQRMKHLLTITSNAFVQSVQKQLSNIDFWSDSKDSIKNREHLRNGANICERWSMAVEQLTSIYWRNYLPHPWKGEPFQATYLIQFKKRLNQIISIRSSYDQSLRFNPSMNKENFSPNIVFAPFSNLNPIQFNPYTDPQWNSAMDQFENIMSQADRDIARQLREHFQKIRSDPQQMLSDFKRYFDLIQRDTIRQELAPERELLLKQFENDLKTSTDDFQNLTSGGKKSNTQGGNRTAIAVALDTSRQIEAKVNTIINDGNKLVSDLSGFARVASSAKQLKQDIIKWRKDKFKEWCQDTIRAIDDPSQALSLETSGRLMEIDSRDGKLRVLYGDRLTNLLNEVRQLSSLDYEIPSKITKWVEIGKKFSQYGIELQAVAHFYNTIDSEMIPSQQPMMLDLAKNFERLVKDQKLSQRAGNDSGIKITWENPEQLSRYILTLRAAAEKFKTENLKLRRYHSTIQQIVCSLMNTDLLRERQKWNDQTKEIRKIMENLITEGYSADNMKAWRSFWDRQLYKALDLQYSIGLKAFNENLPDIKLDLIFGDNSIQYKLPNSSETQSSIETIKITYFNEMKIFLTYPLTYNGCRDTSSSKKRLIYENIISRHSKDIVACFLASNELFGRLEHGLEQFKEWIVLGQVDIEELVEKYLLDVNDWEKNFRILKIRTQDAEKLPNEVRYDCFLVNINPLKLTIENQIRRLNDSMLTHLKRSITRDAVTINSFVNEGLETLNDRPRTHEELGSSYKKHDELKSKRQNILPLYDRLESKNKLLRSVAGGGHDQLVQLQLKLDKFETMMDSHIHMIGEQKDVLKRNLKSRYETFLNDSDKMKSRWKQIRPRDQDMEDEKKCRDSLKIVREREKEIQEMVKQKEKMIEEFKNFGMNEPEFHDLDEVYTDITRIKNVWGIYEEFQEDLGVLAKEDWVTFRSKTYRFDEFLAQWQEKLKELSSNESTKSSKKNSSSNMNIRIQEDIENYRLLTPLFKWVRGETLSPDHWIELFRILQIPRGITLEKLTFGDILKAKDEIMNNSNQLKDLNARAQAEHTIREALYELETWGAGAQFLLTDYIDIKQQKIQIIKDWKDLFTQIGDNQSLLSSLKDSPYYKNFEGPAQIWEQRLGILDECLHTLNQIQRKFVYLEPIFGRGALPKEQGRFRGVDKEFRDIMSEISSNPRLVIFAQRKDLSNMLKSMLDQLGRCQKALNELLEEKRSIFPRFYFIGDDDLLEILGQSTNPTVIQTHLKKLFAGIHSVVFDETNQNILAMCSLDGEHVPLTKKIHITTSVEEWLKELSKEMINTLQQLLINALQESKKQLGQIPIEKYPSQISCLAESIIFTERCEEAIKNGQLDKFYTNIQQVLEKYTTVDVNTDSIEGVVTDLKYKALIMDTVHNMDVVQQLRDARIKNNYDWLWQKQLRFYLENNKAIIRMVDAQFNYTYEYQGNAQKLVHTPLTDKCYLTLTQGMHMGFGGNPYGPAGTGKTESVKALGSTFGRQVLVFNCDEGIDVKSIGRIFIGICKSDAWGCFDEFNRLDEAVLSAVSMQIQVIQDALKTGASSLTLLDRKIEINPNSGIFVTLNPAGKGYGGRSKLPDNLKQLFRPVAMSKPNNELIAEVLLYSDGFKNANVLARKLVALFNLSKELLTTQQHYDWGLRALKTVLKGCGTLLRDARANKVEISSKYESQLVVQASRINTLSKLTFGDSKRFDGLLQDIFPGIDLRDIEYENLRQALHEVYQEHHLLINDIQIRKALELYEQLRQRMGVVIVGPSGSGKSVLWKMLQHAMLKIDQTVRTYIMNPKSMPRIQLLGHIDIDTREWSDGVLTAASRAVVKEPLEIQSWIVCDGDVDPEWVESLNSVLDDNRLLTMPSGERIQFGPNVNFLFETHDLSCASPATISRMGMIFLSDEDTDIKSVVQSWLAKEPAETRSKTEKLINEYFFEAFNWIIQQEDFVVETTLVGTVLNGLSHLHGVQNKALFALGLIRGLGGNVNEKTKEAFANEIFNLTGEHSPDSNDILSIKYDERSNSLTTYKNDDKTELSVDNFNNMYDLPVIRTIDIQRYLDSFLPWLNNKHRQPFLVVGPDGCGKGTLLRYCFRQLRSTQVAILHCSAQTSPIHVIQKLNQSCIQVSSTNGRTYRPKDCENLILYVKDINLPKLDKWGTSQLIEFLQQILTYNGFYDENLEFVNLENIQIVGSMNPSNTLGRHKLSTRFTSIVRICSINYPNEDQLQIIYANYLRPILQYQLPNHRVWSSSGKIQQLALSMIHIYNELRARFTQDVHSHYLFTPRDLTRWCLSLLRYDLSAIKNDATPENLLEIWIYEACRLFKDRLVGNDAQEKFDQLIDKTLKTDWSSNALASLKDSYFVSWPNHNGRQTLPPAGRILSRLSIKDLKPNVERGIGRYRAEYRDIDVFLFREILDAIVRCDRVLTTPGGSLLLAGRSGIGRHTAIGIVASMNNMKLFSPKVSRTYGIKQFKNDLKTILQSAGVEGDQCILLIEDYQFIESTFVELINSLLSAGEIPGLYTSDELESILSPLREESSQEGFRGTMVQYFAQRVKTNLHIVLIMDFTRPTFTIACQSNPGFFKECAVQWMEGWSERSMLKIPSMLFSKDPSEENIKDGLTEKIDLDDELSKSFYHIHKTMEKKYLTPKRFLILLETYRQVYLTKHQTVSKRQQHLKSGVSKLSEARKVVDDLKRNAEVKQKELGIKQHEADEALKQITKSMADAGTQKTEMEQLAVKVSEETVVIERQKREIDAELAETQPLVDQAKQAVSSLRPETLVEIRSLRAPPDVVRDILEGVLKLMGQLDTSWNSMKAFLGKRGVKEDIMNFDPRNVTVENRESVEKLLRTKADSFSPENAAKASQVAGPLAAWVTANVKYSKVLERIRPLVDKQNKLTKSLESSTRKMDELSFELKQVDSKVEKYRTTFEKTTNEAQRLKVDLEKATETIDAAQNLVGKLEGEFYRWSSQVNDLNEQLKALPKLSLLSAGFITYLASQSEDKRIDYMSKWKQILKVDDKFDVRKFLSTESEQLVWKSQGLPSDDLSMENAIVILRSQLCPFLVDPSSRATDWLKTHLKNKKVEVINQQDSNFTTQLELAVRFGKTLIVQEVDGVEPVLYPILRKDLAAQGPRHVVQIGEKVIDYNPDFRIYLTTRNPTPELLPDMEAIVNEVNFTTTRAGLTGQLLATAIQHEKPELEVRKTELLRKEEELKIELAKLEDQLLEDLANATGNILENKELLESLNKTKEKSATITNSLEESAKLGEDLDKERNDYLPFAKHGSKLFFVISDLSKVNNMYQFSLSAFLRLFQRNLEQTDKSSSQDRILALGRNQLRIAYTYVTRSLFKSDRLMFAMHLAHGMFPKKIPENEWEHFIGISVIDVKETRSVPSWVNEERAFDVSAFKTNFPELFSNLRFDDSSWSKWNSTNECELKFPQDKQVTSFQQLLIIQAFRPDRLESAMRQFACNVLDIPDISPETLNLKKLYSKETISTEPILIIISPGADPSAELTDLAIGVTGKDKYSEIAMGQGQMQIALDLLKKCSSQGSWLCLKNLHLVTSWLTTLEKELNALKPHKDFRLWLTSEVHPKFPTILLQSSLKITYEAPPGIKKNLLRTFENWTQDEFGKGGTTRSQTLFVLAWFHAIVQERRKYIPQGWTKFYEFSQADLRAGYEIIHRLCERATKQSGGEIQWDYIHGLFDQAVYGGRVDNPVDIDVLRSYLIQYFNSAVISGSKGSKNKLTSMITIPNSSDLNEYKQICENLNDDQDAPSLFGLPANIERSAQRMNSSQIISSLKILQRTDVEIEKFDKDKWSALLTPLLNLWKKLNQDAGLLKLKVHPPTEDGSLSPIQSFLQLERYNGIELVQTIHENLAALSKVIRGISLITNEVQEYAKDLLQNETPQTWQNRWEGPTDPMQYLRAVVSKAKAMTQIAASIKDREIFSQTINLSDLFRPDTFLNALRQQTARETKQPMDTLVLNTSWSGEVKHGKNVSVKISGLQLEGCSFDSGRLSESAPDSPSVTSFPSCYIAWISRDVAQQETHETISLPVYFSATRDRIITRLNVPCGSNKDKWLQCGAALFLKNF
ncbi:unnamed protein product [Adineta steineri]|uniref:Cytoplasmic dynein 2 heavy chain 1 n=2 Tax=Adineta steineri TaxID=433720 RepID=A0A818JYQ2_9BILA|nr:unnamed protein product [Adineta steineri]CAF3547459.1 unnamed protein product [Adineta steineri]